MSLHLSFKMPLIIYQFSAENLLSKHLKELFGHARNRILPFAFILLDKSAFKVFSVQRNLSLVPNGYAEPSDHCPLKSVVVVRPAPAKWGRDIAIEPVRNNGHFKYWTDSNE